MRGARKHLLPARGSRPGRAFISSAAPPSTTTQIILALHRLRHGSGMFCLSLLAMCLQPLGEEEQALVRSNAALTLAATLDHPYSRATADNFAGWLYQLRDNPEAARHHAAAALSRCKEHGFPSGSVLAEVRLGWARAMGGELVAGRASIEAGIAAWSALGAKLARAHFLAMHAEVCGAMGDHAAASPVSTKQRKKSCAPASVGWRPNFIASVAIFWHRIRPVPIGLSIPGGQLSPSRENRVHAFSKRAARVGSQPLRGAWPGPVIRPRA